MKTLFLNSFNTKFGTVRTAATEKGLALIALPGEPKNCFDNKIKKLYDDHELTQGGRINRQAEKQISAYLNGKLTKFDLPLEIIGTDFQKKALKNILRLLKV